MNIQRFLETIFNIQEKKNFKNNYYLAKFSNESTNWIKDNNCHLNKLQQITRPAIAIHQNLADSTITRVRTHVNSMVGIRLEIEFYSWLNIHLKVE